MIYQFEDKQPVIGEDCFIAPNAAVIGDVVLGDRVSIWFSVTVRGDVNGIVIGEGTNIQDNSVIHVARTHSAFIDKNVTVGHKVMLHGCSIGEGTLIGMNAVVLNGAVVGKGCVIGSNALLTEGMEVPDGAMVLGSPGKVVKQLDEQVREKLMEGAVGYSQMAASYRRSLRKIDNQ